MGSYEKALTEAKKNGHELVNDPPVFASVNRSTCKKCGRAVLGNSRTAYGSATEGPCIEVQSC